MDNFTSNDAETLAKKGSSKSSMRTRMIVTTGMLGALSAILMLFEFPFPLAPTFIKFDFSELPVILGGFLFGPVAGCIVALIKILLNFVLNGTSTAGVGEVANLVGSICFILPASIIYFKNKTRKRAAIGLVAGTVSTSVVMSLMNAFLLCPLYIKLFGMTEEVLIGMGSATNPFVHDMLTLVLCSIFPFNIVKYGIVSVITFLIYKRISKFVKAE
ncbi:MAG: ECF transporter S component [Lachnospiraceae bacterium]|nr:ECF transporter S component [Lachnospiraceae bacterium]